jgi:AraC-like DNA-binding protein
MQRAALLLATTRDKLLTIAASVGYMDEFAFSVAFKRWNGVAPSKFRESKRQQ